MAGKGNEGNVNEKGRKREKTENKIKRLHVQKWGGGQTTVFQKGRGITVFYPVYTVDHNSTHNSRRENTSMCGFLSNM
jgi:hypothetical protein